MTIPLPPPQSRLKFPQFGVAFWSIAICLGSVGCTSQPSPSGNPLSTATQIPSTTEVEFWTCGSEGELIRPIIARFESTHPQIRVKIQQIPWSAAHEKLVTAFAGESLPDLCQLGNTWIPEFHALGALTLLDPLIEKSKDIAPEQYFQGIWQTNQIDAQTYGVPWYVDTRVLFYRHDLLMTGGINQPPATWEQWLQSMKTVQSLMPTGGHAILLPIDEWETPTILGLQTCDSLLRESNSFGNFRSPQFRRAFRFYTEIFRKGYAPVIGATQISNLWHELANDRYAMYITGPWNVSQFRKQLPPDQLAKWSASPLPAPNPPTGSNADTTPGASMAGGCSLVMFRNSQVKDAAWQLIEFLSTERAQIELFQLVGNLPAKQNAWRHPDLADDPWLDAFRRQLMVAKPLPQVPEWERIATKVAEAAERAIRGKAQIDNVVSQLDQQVDAFLEKRRWMMARVAESLP